MNDDLSAGLPEPDSMRAAADSACALLNAVESPIGCCCFANCRKERCVSDLETALDIRQPTLSQQLGVLRDNALVRTRREGKNIHYSLDSPAAIAVMGVLYEQFCGPAAKGRRDAA